MSQQQQQIPGPAWENEQTHARESGWLWGQRGYGPSNKAKTREMPKNEHPATFEQSLPPYVYPAQDGGQSSMNTQAQRQQSTSEYRVWQKGHGRGGRHLSPDGDALEHGYRPYNQYPYNQYQGGVPAWARPQRSAGNKAVRLLVLIVLGLALLHALPAILTIALALIGVIAVAVLLPFIIVFAAVAAFAVLTLVVLKALGVPVGRIVRRGVSYRRRSGW